MQRYHAVNCTSAVNNSAIGGGSARDSTSGRSDSLATNFSINPRRPPPLAPYKLKCVKEPLNSRLGPPDFYPQTLNCPEETLTREYLQSGYRETVEGLEESKELILSQSFAFTKPVVIRCREAIRKCLRTINESRAQKRKAGQVYGVPLSGSLLSKAGVFPEQRPCSEDSKKKWVEGLSQPHKRLRLLADHVPHGYRRKFLFEVLIRNNVPLLRATWYIKVNYLNQIRPSSTGISSGTSDKAQSSRTDLWTKDFVEYLQNLLDEFTSRSNASAPQSRDRSPQMPYTVSLQKSEPVVLDSEEPSLHFKWWYVVRLLHWHHTEGLLSPSVVIDWVLTQLQEKEVLEILQLLLPIIYGFLESVVLSQTYVRSLAGIAIRFIREPSPGGSDLVDNSRRAYTTSALIEMLRYLILAVPDTFVALDCFPLPPSVMSYATNDGTFASKASERPRHMKENLSEVACIFRSKGLDAQYQSLSLNQVVCAIEKCADNLARTASPSYPIRSMAKAVQALDKALLQGDISGAYSSLFERFCDGPVDWNWIEEVSSWLKSSLKWIGTVSVNFICSVFLLCEWATCDYRDFRSAPPVDLKFSGGKDFSQVHVVIRLLKLKLREMQSPHQQKNSSSNVGADIVKGNGKHGYFSRTTVTGGYEMRSNSRTISSRHVHSSHIYESPGPLHDIIVCWMDQHEICRGEGLKRLQLLMMELIRSGVFYPHVYVRQLSSSGITDMNGHATDLHRRRHYQILKHLPSLFVRDILQEAKVAEGSRLVEIMRVYSNERRLLLNGLLCRQYKSSPKFNTLQVVKFVHPDSGPPDNLDKLKTILPGSSVTPKRAKMDVDTVELKTSISALLRFPNSSMPSDSGQDESQGSIRKPPDSSGNKMEALEGTPGCEDCRKAKRQKLSEERSSYPQGNSSISDDEDTWWMLKGGPKIFDSAKLDPPLKPPKQVSKGRQKIVRKTQSLAHLAASRMESNQEASTSHVCDNKVSCPHHRTGVEGSIDVTRTTNGDVASIRKAIKRLQLAEKRAITNWLVAVVKQLVEETENNASKMSQFTRPYVSADDGSSALWKLGEDELSTVLYLLDACGDLVSAAKLLLWLLPKVTSNLNSTIHSGRNMMMLMKNVENHACEVGEAFLVSSIRRYENILVVTDLIPEVLSAAMQRIVALLPSSGRVSGAGLVYSRHLLRKYGHLPSVSEWEKNFKAKCDKRLLPELDYGRSTDGDFGFPLGVPAGVEDVDDFVRQKMSVNRLSRLGVSMRDIVQRNTDDVFQYFYGKDRKVFSTGIPKNPGLEKYEDGNRLAHQIVTSLMECIRQTGGAAQEGDPSLVSSAVSAIIHNIGSFIAKMPEFTGVGNSPNSLSAMGSLNFARRILRVHLNCLCLLKEALGERQSRVFEIALANEASSALATTFAPAKTSRGQFQVSPEVHDSSANPSTDTSNNATKSPLGRATKCAAAISALVILAVIHGVSSLERIVTVLKLKEGLGITQNLRSIKSNSNGNNRLVGVTKVDTPIEVYVHWFRLLVGNCRTVCDGLVVDFLGEPNVVAFLRMQRMLPISLVFPPAYSIFAFVIWRPLIINSSLTAREDVQQLYNSMTMAIGDAIKHLPFRDTCLRDSQGFYDLVAADNSDVEFAALIDSNGLDRHFKYMAFVPLRGRLFLNAIIDCKMPQSRFAQEDSNRISGHSGSKVQQAESGAKLLDKLVDVLDTLQPAKFHWQWVELRLLLNEQAVIERLDTHDVPLADAIRSASPGAGNASDNDNNIIEIILTRLLVRPDAAPLFSELVHLLGRSLEDSMLMQAKWFLGGLDVLYGRKTIRQRLVNIAESRGVSTKQQFWKPWGWRNSGFDSVKNIGDNKFEVEEGEVNEESSKMKKFGIGSYSVFESEGSSVSLQLVTERALIDLVLPCIDRSSEDTRNTFANELIKQLNNIEQQISAVYRGASKQGGASSGMETPPSKSNSRKGMRGSSPGLAKQRTAAAVEPAMPSPAGLRNSMSLRLQLLLRLLPTICSNGEPLGRNMRHMLAPVILRLLGSQIVYEDEDRFSPIRAFESKRDAEFTSGDGSADLSGESLFDRLLFVLHALLSGSQPSWLKGRPAFKSTNESSKDFAGCDREVIESLQNDLDRMQLPGTIHWRIQSAMPNLVPSTRCSISCQPPNIPVAAVTCLQPSIPNSSQNVGSQAQRNTVSSTRAATNTSSKSKSLPVQQDTDMEIDPWTLLEDGTGSGPSSSNTAVVNSGDPANLHASNWLKGAVRVRRTDLTYIGAVDDDS